MVINVQKSTQMVMAPPSIVSTAILSKATWRLHFSKLLKARLLDFCLTVIWPILECAAPVWHHLLTKSQTDQIEAIHKRAVNIIYVGTYGMPYTNTLFPAGLMSLTEHGEQLALKLFDSVEEPISCLHHLLAPLRDSALLSRLRAPSKFPRIAQLTQREARNSLGI